MFLEDRLNAKILELSGSVINDFTLELTQLKVKAIGASAVIKIQISDRGNYYQVYECI